MKKKKPETRVQGVYRHPTGGYQVVYYEDGVQRTQYAKEKPAADAIAERMKAKFGNTGPKLETRVPRGGQKTYPTDRGTWITAIWDQVDRLRQIESIDLVIPATKAIVDAYKAIRDDLEILRYETGKPDDPASMNTKTLERRLDELKSIAKAA